MVVIGIVKGDGMFDWHSEYLVIQARQREIASAAGFGRLLAEARGSAAGKQARSPARRGLRYRLGAVLILLGRRLQGGLGLGKEVLTPRPVSSNLP